MMQGMKARGTENKIEQRRTQVFRSLCTPADLQLWILLLDGSLFMPYLFIYLFKQTVFFSSTLKLRFGQYNKTEVEKC